MVNSDHLSYCFSLLLSNCDQLSYCLSSLLIHSDQLSNYFSRVIVSSHWRTTINSKVIVSPHCWSIINSWVIVDRRWTDVHSSVSNPITIWGLASRLYSWVICGFHLIFSISRRPGYFDLVMWPYHGICSELLCIIRVSHFLQNIQSYNKQ